MPAASDFLSLQGSLRQLMLYLQDFGYIRGNVFYRNRPIKDVKIYVLDATTETLLTVLKPAADGTFTVEKMQKNRLYHIFVVGKDGNKTLTSTPWVYATPSDIAPAGTPAYAEELDPFKLPQTTGLIPAPGFETAKILDWIENQMISVRRKVDGFSIELNGALPEFGYVGTLSGSYSLPVGLNPADYRLRIYHTTDVDYPQGTSALSGGSFSVIGGTASGYVKVAIERISDLEVMAETGYKTFVPRSYELEPTDSGFGTPFQHRAYTYDMALGLLSAEWSSDTALADRLLGGLLSCQHANGAFPFSLTHYSPEEGYLTPAMYRTGANAWVGYALACVLQNRPTHPRRGEIRTALTSLCAYLVTLQTPVGQTAGLFRGGSGRYVNDVFVPEYTIAWYSTEHNLDLVFMWDAVAKVLPVTAWASKTAQEWFDAMSVAVPSKLWMSSQGRFYQGLSNDSGTPDTADALDCNSWGFLAIHKIATSGLPKWALLKRTEEYYKVDNDGLKGYKPYSALFGYPSAEDVIWGEGTFGVALAYWRGGWKQAWEEIILSILPGQEGDKSFRYSVTKDADAYEISSSKSMASTCWYLLTRNHPDKLWS